MARNLVIFFSFILALGNLVDLFGAGILEILAIIVGFLIIIERKNQKNILKYGKQAFPLFIILVILFFANVFYGYTGIDDQFLNLKFLLAIVIYILLSAFFENDKKGMLLSLLLFSIGTAILSILYFFDLLQGGLELRKDRLIFLGENPNSLSIRISLGVFLLIWMSLKNIFNSIFKRILLLIPVPFMIALIVASGSKGSFVLCILSVLMLIFISKNISKKYKYIFISFLFIFLVFSLDFLLKSNLYERFAESELTTGRLDIWKEAMDIFYSNPFGVGENGYKQEIKFRIGESLDTHNVFIYLLVTGGLISLVLFIYFYLKILQKSIISYKISREPVFIIIWISMFIIMSKTGGVLTYLIMWYFLAVINSYKVS